MALLRDNLEPTDFADAIVKVSEWRGFDDPHYRMVRVWVCKCSNHWFQRHEWMPMQGNETRLEEWIYFGHHHKRKFKPHMSDIL